eukprot:8685650-Ditylum_brightwellii.AAC.1
MAAWCKENLPPCGAPWTTIPQWWRNDSHPLPTITISLKRISQGSEVLHQMLPQRATAIGVRSSLDGRIVFLADPLFTVQEICLFC